MTKNKRSAGFVETRPEGSNPQDYEEFREGTRRVGFVKRPNNAPSCAHCGEERGNRPMGVSHDFDANRVLVHAVCKERYEQAVKEEVVARDLLTRSKNLAQAYKQQQERLKKEQEERDKVSENIIPFTRSERSTPKKKGPFRDEVSVPQRKSLPGILEHRTIEKRKKQEE